MIKLELSEEMIQRIGIVLSEKPYREVADIMETISNQLKERCDKE